MVLKPWGVRKTPTKAYLPQIQEKLGAIPGIQMFPIMPSALPGADNFPVSFVITSTADQERILEFAKQIFAKAMQAHIFQFGDIDTKIDQPQAQINFDHDKVAALGLDMQQVGADISASIGGNYVNRFNIEGRSYKVIPQIKRVDRLNPEQLKNIYVSGPNNQLIPLSTVASINHKTVARSLNRMQQLNAVTISGVPAVSLDAALKFLQDEANKILPKGYVLDYTGESRQLQTEGSKFLGRVFAFAGANLSRPGGAVQQLPRSFHYSVGISPARHVRRGSLHVFENALWAILHRSLDYVLQHLFAGRSRDAGWSRFEERNPDCSVRERVATAGSDKIGGGRASCAHSSASHHDDERCNGRRSLSTHARNRRGRCGTKFDRSCACRRNDYRNDFHFVHRSVALHAHRKRASRKISHGRGLGRHARGCRSHT